MSVTALVTNYIKFSGDLENELVYSSGDQSDSPAIQELIALSNGDNVIELPSVEGFTVHGVAIVPPALNEMEAVIKGSTTDSVGITLSAFNVSLLQFGATPPTDIVLVASTNAAGFRLIWF
jgi:hypothetical protein